MGTGDGGTGGGGSPTPLSPEMIVALTRESDALTKALERQDEQLEKLNTKKSEQEAGSKRYLEIEKQVIALQVEKQKNLLSQIENEIKLNGISDDRAQKLREQKEQLEEFTNKLEAATEALDSFNLSMTTGAQVGDNLAQSIGITDSSLSKFFDNLEEGNISLDGFVEGMKSSFSPTKVATSAINTYIDSNIELFQTLQTVNSELNKTFTPEYANRIINSTNSIEVSLRRYNIGFDESAEAVETLNNNMSDFANLTDDQISSLATDSALMTKFGVSNEDYADTIQDMTKGFGDSIEAAQENMREMRSFSGAIGKSTKEVMADFNKVKGFLAQYGSNYEGIFRRMEVITRKTGVAIEDLQSIAQGFDEFEGAATAVGKFNALLGGPFLNTIDMLNTEDPAEQIMKLKQAFDSAGKSVNSMTRRELQAFAGSIPGINGDITKMKKLFGQLDEGVLGSADSINEFIEGSDDSTEMLKTQAELTMTLKDTFNAIKKMIAENGPLIQSLMTTLQSGLQGIATLGENIRYVMFDVAKIFTKVMGGPGKFMQSVYKFFGKEALTKIPVLGLLVGGLSALSRLANGDIIGAAAELVSAGFATLGPGIGTAVSVGIDAALLGTDVAGYTGAASPLAKKTSAYMYGTGQEEGEETEMAVGGIVTREVNNVTIGERGREAVIPLEDGKDYLVDPLSKAVAKVGGGGFGGTPNINLTVMLEGRELRAFVKNVIVENLNPLK